MSMVFSGRGLTIVASDTRWTWISVGDRAVDGWFDDHGAKVRRVPGGWVAATGEARLCAYGLRKLEQHGVGCVQAAFNESLAETFAHPAMAGRTEVDLTHFLVGADDGTIEVVSTDPGDSCRVEPKLGKLQLRASWAAGLTAERQRAVQSAFAERVVSRHTVAGVIHAIASAFVEAREHDVVSLSDEVEIGVSGAVFGHLRGKASDVVTSCLRSSGRGGVVLNPPPVLPPFPELPAERQLFTPYSMAG